MESKMEMLTRWSYGDDANYTYIKMRYADRQAIGDEAIAKRKAFEKMSTDDPFYHRAAVSAEMAQMRWDMAYMVSQNDKMKEYVETIDWLHQQVGVLQGAYGHVKMLAEKAGIDYAISETTMKAIDAGLKTISKLKQELENETSKRSNGTDGAES